MDTCFPAIIGNEKLKHRLALEIKEGRFPHAYIIAGKSGSGKMTLALNIAAALACENAHTLPCGECDSCRKVYSEFSPDVIILRKEDGKKEFSVNLIREIKNGLYIAPSEFEKRIYIIEDAELMNISAQNAFLKMLEEPPHYAVFLLLCANVGNLLDTIKSRAPILYTETIPEEAIRSYLLAHSPRAKELATSNTEELNAILHAAGGSIGQAMYLCNDAEKYKALKKLSMDFLDALTAHASADFDLICDDMPTDSTALREFLDIFKRALRDIAVYKNAPSCALLYFEDAERAEKYAMKFTISKAISMIESADKLLADLLLNLDARLAAATLVSSMRAIMTK